MTSIVDTVEEVTPDWMTEALGQGTVTGIETEVMSTGQLGHVARATLTYADEAPTAPRTLMVKLPRADEGSRQLGVILGVYEAEVRFYQQIAPTVDVNVPQLFWGDVEPQTGRFTLLIEDLSDVGEPGDMIAGGTVDQAAGALDALVALQAPRWSDPSLAELGWLADPARNQVMFAGVEPALPVFLERFGDHLEAEDRALVERIAPKANAWCTQMNAGPNVVVHGDFRMDNLFFPHDSGRPVTVFDWQAARLGPPLVDACVYVGGCLSLEERRANERDLLQRYHEGLVAAGVDGFSFDAVWESYRWCVFYGLMLSVSMSVGLEQTERGDALFAGMVRAYAQHARDLDSEDLLG